MNFKKFHFLHDRLIQLLAEKEELFIAERPFLLDWLLAEQLSKKYPDIKISKAVNRETISMVIDELHLILNPEKENYDQAELIFT